MQSTWDWAIPCWQSGSSAWKARTGKGGKCGVQLKTQRFSLDHKSRKLNCPLLFTIAMVNGDLDKKSHLGRIASNRDRTKCFRIVYFCRKFMQNYTCKPPKMPNLIFCVTFGRLLLTSVRKLRKDPCNQSRLPSRSGSQLATCTTFKLCTNE